MCFNKTLSRLRKNILAGFSGIRNPTIPVCTAPLDLPHTELFQLPNEGFLQLHLILSVFSLILSKLMKADWRWRVAHDSTRVTLHQCACARVSVCVRVGVIPRYYCKLGIFVQSEKEFVTTCSERFVCSFQSVNCEMRSHSDIVYQASQKGYSEFILQVTLKYRFFF
jgi:hypothetical protein